RTLARHVGIIPVPYQGPRALKAAIAAVQAALDRGQVVLIFPEAQLSRNGLLGPFYRGLEVMMKGRAEVPVVPVYLDQVWGSLFSHSGGRFFRKRPQGWRRRVVVVFGPPVPPPITAFEVRQAVQAASVQAAEHAPKASRLPETIDSTLPQWEHPSLGLLSVSTLDFEVGEIRQVGQKPGTTGQAPPGVALRIVDDAGRPLPAEVEGRIQVRLPGRAGWIETDRRGCLDRDGFLRHSGTDAPA
ncbi:MAG: 1-acyl-sn-glycerol-3-phosphate acyltransferase, partial [Isosphaeraceae bacterium]